MNNQNSENSNTTSNTNIRNNKYASNTNTISTQHIRNSNSKTSSHFFNEVGRLSGRASGGRAVLMGLPQVEEVHNFRCHQNNNSSEVATATALHLASRNSLELAILALELWKPRWAVPQALMPCSPPLPWLASLAVLSMHWHQ